MKLNLILFTILLPTLLLGQGSEGISKKNLANADLQLIENHDPQVEKENFDLLPGYEVNLFAQEPMLANPIHMTWDNRGRLWVACSWAGSCSRVHPIFDTVVRFAGAVVTTY